MARRTSEAQRPGRQTPWTRGSRLDHRWMSRQHRRCCTWRGCSVRAGRGRDVERALLSYARAPRRATQTQCQRSSRQEHALAASNLRGDRAADQQGPTSCTSTIRQPVERVLRGVERAEQPHTASTSADPSGRGGRCRRARRRSSPPIDATDAVFPRTRCTLQTMSALTSARPSHAEHACVGPRCAARYGTAPPVMAEMMSRSGAFDAITMAAVAPGVRRPTPARTSVIADERVCDVIQPR